MAVRDIEFADRFWIVGRERVSLQIDELEVGEYSVGFVGIFQFGIHDGTSGCCLGRVLQRGQDVGLGGPVHDVLALSFDPVFNLSQAGVADAFELGI